MATGDDSCAFVADVGGTSARFLCAPISRPLRDSIDPLVLRCADYVSFGALLADALARLELRCEVSVAVLAAAGPVASGTIPMVNVPWVVDEARCREFLGAPRCVLVNDCEAIAHLVATNLDAHLEPVGGGAAVGGGTRVVVGPGTGLGVAAVTTAEPSGAAHVISGEGGNVGFAPGDVLESDLAAALRRRSGRAFVEQILSGSGLQTLFGWIKSGALVEPGEGPSTESIVARARDGEVDARAAVDRFLGCLGAHAGDLALTFGARGGVMLTGGVCDALRWRLNDSPFRDRFEAKGRHRSFVSLIPTSWISCSYPGLRGAFAHAVAMTGASTST